MQDIYDRGSILMIEITFWKNDAFTARALFDPDNYPTITVTDPDGNVKTDAQNMTNSSTGKWYYKLQIAVNWLVGEYVVRIDATSGTDTDVTIKPKGFILK